MKTFTIHLDAVLVLVLLAVGLIAFVLYQHQEQGRLFQQTMDLSWQLQDAQTRMVQMQRQLADCGATSAR